MTFDREDLVSPLMCGSKISADEGLLNFKMTIPFGTAPLPDYIYDTDFCLEHSLTNLEKMSNRTTYKKQTTRDSSRKNLDNSSV